MKLHPLRRAYIDQIQFLYNTNLWGDKKPERTEVIAQRVRGLGISYNAFIRLTVSMWTKWTKDQGHPYPYWNIVTSDKSFEALKNYLGLLSLNLFDDGVDADEWTLELMFAVDYIDWINSKTIHSEYKPRRETTKPNAKVRIAVSEYICQLHGIEFITSNYHFIAKQLANG